MGNKVKVTRAILSKGGRRPGRSAPVVPHVESGTSMTVQINLLNVPIFLKSGHGMITIDPKGVHSESSPRASAREAVLASSSFALIVLPADSELRRIAGFLRIPP